jgi:nitric oxide synthase oxygenase domain/subunit
MAYKGTETDVLYGVEMAWRADATAHARLHFLTAKWLNVIIPGK